MWTCPQCGEQIEDRFDTCAKCAAPAPVLPNRKKQFFLAGVLFELLVIFLSMLRSDDWLLIEAQNFFVVTHYPLMLLFSIAAPGDNMLIMLMGLPAIFLIMSAAWGFLFFLILRLWHWGAARLTCRRRIVLGRTFGLTATLGLAWLVVSAWPAPPIPFTATPEVQTAVTGNNTFALDLYRQLAARPGNLFFSPYGLSASLALAGAGARGQTQNEFTNVLHLPLPTASLPEAFGPLAARLNQIQRWNRIALRSANSVWCQQDHPFTAAYLNLARTGFAAETRAVDFAHHPDDACRDINQWADQMTKHRITGLVSPGQLDSATRLALCDALCFQGKWRSQFKTGDTKPLPFYVTTNETVTVPMMCQKAKFKIARSEDETVKLLELSYYGGDLSMILLMPETETAYLDPDQPPGVPGLPGLEQKLTAENLRHWLFKLDQASPRETSVSLPRFKINQSLSLAATLKTLGLTSAFADTADFSGMDGTKNLYLSEAIHQASVAVDESGTEAAAVSLMGSATRGIDGRFKADHPFLYLIRDNGSGAILFLGRMVNPAASSDQ